MNPANGQESHKEISRKAYVARVCGNLILCGALSTALPGCNSSISTTTGGAATPTVQLQDKIRAQGQIMPADGLIRLAATPGDIVEAIDAKVGDPVTKGKTLVIMRSLKLHEARIEALQSRLTYARQQQADAVQQARIQLTVAETKVRQADSQTKALKRQENLLALGKEQVSAAEKALERIESVANDPLTSSFVGATQVDQQRIAVGEAELKYEQQAESYEQAQEAAKLSVVAADQELKAAQLALASAEQSMATKAIEAELKGLQLSLESAYVKAPQNAIVVAVNTRIGEAAAQYPLIELADVTRVICTAEVVEGDARRVQPDQKVLISSPALPRVLNGKVLRIARLVGRPQLAVADPLAKVDYRSVSVDIAIDPADVPVAADWLQLQVSVEIQMAEKNDNAPAVPTSDSNANPKSDQSSDRNAVQTNASKS